MEKMLFLISTLLVLSMQFMAQAAGTPQPEISCYSSVTRCLKSCWASTPCNPTVVKACCRARAADPAELAVWRTVNPRAHATFTQQRAGHQRALTSGTITAAQTGFNCWDALPAWMQNCCSTPQPTRRASYVMEPPRVARRATMRTFGTAHERPTREAAQMAWQAAGSNFAGEAQIIMPPVHVPHLTVSVIASPTLPPQSSPVVSTAASVAAATSYRPSTAGSSRSSITARSAHGS